MRNSYLEKEYSDYCNKVYKFAENKFDEIIKPYLIKHGYKFLSGNGIYFIKDKRGIQIDHEDLPKYIYDLLSMEIPGMEGNDLGSLMPDFENK